MRIKTSRVDITLDDKVKLLLVIGPNGAGKTNLLEEIAFGTALLDPHMYALQVYEPDLSYIEELRTEEQKEVAKLVAEYFDDSILYVYTADEPRALLKDLTDLPVRKLGRGMSSIISLVSFIVHNRPELLLVHDFEQYSLDAVNTQKLARFILDQPFKTIISATSNYAILIEEVAAMDRDDEVMLLLMNRSAYELMTVEEALDIMDYENLTQFAMRIREAKGSEQAK